MGICEGTKLGWTSNNIKAVILLQNIFLSSKSLPRDFHSLNL